MSKAKMRSGGLCYLCGKIGAETVEHIVPRNLYPGPLGPPVQAAAHRACNATTTKQEEAFRNLLAPFAPDDSPILDKMVRSLKDPKAKGMRADFDKRMQQLEDGSGVIGIPEGHSAWVLAKIIKGLVFLEHDNHVISSSSVRWIARRIAPEMLAKQTVALPYGRVIPTVLSARWARAPDVPVHAYLRFYGSPLATFGITAIPANRRLFAKEHDAVVLTWPKPAQK